MRTSAQAAPLLPASRCVYNVVIQLFGRAVAAYIHVSTYNIGACGPDLITRAGYMAPHADLRFVAVRRAARCGGVVGGFTLNDLSKRKSLYLHSLNLHIRTRNQTRNTHIFLFAAPSIDFPTPRCPTNQSTADRILGPHEIPINPLVGYLGM